MANNTDSNITRKLARVFLEKCEASRVLTKGINSQLLSGKFNPSSGDTVDFKRPHDYKSKRTAAGDISSGTRNDIISGKASGVVQEYFTVDAEWTNLEEAIQLDQLDEILSPMATRIVTDLELDLGAYMLTNCGLAYGSPGTAVDAWSDVAGAGALMDSLGVPKDEPWCYAMNPFTTTELADTQSGLASGKNSLVDTAWERAQIADNFGGMQVLSSNALSSRTSAVAADRAGTLSGAPTATYLAAKDTMTQVWSVTAFTASATVKAGDVIEVTGRNRLGLSTRSTFLDAAGAQVKYRAIVTADVTLDGSGAGDLVVTGPAIWETNGQYNTVDSALDTGDVVTILGTTGAIYQPNLFFHKQAFGIGTVKIPKLYSTDTVATTEDGFSIRVSKYADGDANKQIVRFDLLPAFATFNPFFAGHGYGVA